MYLISLFLYLRTFQESLLGRSKTPSELKLLGLVCDGLQTAGLTTSFAPFFIVPALFLYNPPPLCFF